MDLLFIAALLGMMYFLMIRPQQKRQQEMARMLGSLEVGDDVITVGGMYGTIAAIDDEHVDLHVTADGMTLRFRKDAISRVINDVDDSIDSEDSADDALDAAPITDDLSTPQDATPSDDLTAGPGDRA